MSEGTPSVPACSDTHVELHGDEPLNVQNGVGDDGME